MSKSHTTKAYDASAALASTSAPSATEMRAPPPVVSQAPKHRYSRASSITAASSSHASQRSESPPRTQRCQKWRSAPPPQPSNSAAERGAKPSSSQQKASSVKRSERFSRQPATGSHGAVGDGRRSRSKDSGWVLCVAQVQPEHCFDCAGGRIQAARGAAVGDDGLAVPRAAGNRAGARGEHRRRSCRQRRLDRRQVG